MIENAMAENYWLEHCLKPRARPSGIDWDVFISYRSADRVWALALYDMLRQCGYNIFLDQYVLQAGGGVLSQLSFNLRRSASGVIVWSERSEDSTWVEREVSAMVELKDSRAGSPNPFHFVAAKLDAQPLPTLLAGGLYIDFSAYPDGPTGSELVRLTSGLQGASLDPPAVQRIAVFDEQVREEPTTLRALVATGQFDSIRDRALSDLPAYTSAATLVGLAAQLLLSGEKIDDALAVLDRGQTRFRRSIRLRQLRGLALRRAGRNQEALLELEKLRADGHNDPETLGILAAAWTASWKQSQNRDQLERARDLYAQAFERSPSDTYSGINAASKSAVFGEMDRAVDLAQRVLAILKRQSDARGGQPPSDYWERVTEPEALFLQSQFSESLKLYHAARIAHQEERGSIRSTWAQLELLLALPFVPEEWRAKFRSEFAAFAGK
jgi:tetratricopeptide (TPR) repeat protein